MTLDDVGALGPWSLTATAPDEIAAPADLARAPRAWLPAPVPGTVAEALQAAGEWSFDRPRDFDAYDWWYRCAFTHDAAGGDGREWLRFRGLATLCDVWLNDVRLLKTDNMFREYAVDVTDRLRRDNTLVLGFRSLGAALAARRPRPRWKTKLVGHQQWRWFRTTLLGRIPGWSPPVAPVGPWRAVRLEHRRPGAVTDVDLRSVLDDDGTGVVELSCGVFHPAATAAMSGELVVGDTSAPVRVDRDETGYRLSACLRVPACDPWWPHTHGRPSLVPCALHVVLDGETRVHDCGGIGFRRVEARRDDGGFALAINGVPIFCRGACWTTSDIVRLRASAADLACDLTLVRDAGANMLRVGGTMLYEDDAFYRLCDELGLLVWQDFMFANMDYPAEDAAFLTSVEIEAVSQIRRLRRHPCLAVYCGNSEVEQQAAMLGVPRAAWRNDLFARVLPELCAAWHPDVPFVPSTPSGGDLPFHVGTGVAHYYGVGAYLRPIADVRRATVRFASECLGFANVPESEVVDLVMGGERAATHAPRWKARTPRDTGAGWDFEDVRDHYLGEWFALDPVRLRSTDPSRYLDLSRVTTGEVMARVFAEWRSAYSTCGGGLVWFLKDLWPGAGWGILDSRGIPKACFHYLRRVWQPRVVVLTDEGLDGLHAHVTNDTDRTMSGTIELTLLRDGRHVILRAAVPCEIGPRSTATFRSDAIFDGFHDVTSAYRFGPPEHDVVAATLYGNAREIVSEAFWFRDAAAVARQTSGAVVADARATGACYALAVTSERFLFAAHVDAPGFDADDNYFCVMPGATKIVHLHARADARDPLDGYLEALNLDAPVRIAAVASERRVAS